MRYDQDDDDEHGTLPDGASLRVPLRMADAARTQPRDSAAFPRPRRGVHVVDGYGDLAGFRPGPRYPAGGNAADDWVRQADRDQIIRAHDAYRHYISNQYKNLDNGDDEDGDDEVEGRRSAILQRLLEAGASPGDAREYSEGLDDDEALDDIDHVRAFQSRYGSNNQDDAARRLIRDRQRLEQLYRQRDFELSQQWRHGK
jgi:hypothetical protein